MIHLKPRGREKIGELTRFQILFCWLVSQLDRIPRYGRYYTLRSDREISDKPHWMFMRKGLWGFYLLDRIDLLWPYIYRTNPDILEWEMEQVAKFTDGDNNEGV